MSEVGTGLLRMRIPQKCGFRAEIDSFGPLVGSSGALTCPGHMTLGGFKPKSDRWATFICNSSSVSTFGTSESTVDDS